MGQAIGGNTGAMAWGNDTLKKIESERDENSIETMLSENSENYSILLKNILPQKSSFKTRWWNTLWLWAPLNIKTNDGKKYFFNVPYALRNKTQKILKSVVKF